ncbi:MAG TPA: flavodoxin family protein [Clostridia bacterium]|nr:flavodoxin family protein [Clostridia bacterium]
MKILALLGSPRKNGNTSLLLDEYLRGIEETGKPAEITKIYLNDKDIHGCNACEACRSTAEQRSRACKDRRCTIRRLQNVAGGHCPPEYCAFFLNCATAP